MFFSCQTESRERQNFSKQPQKPLASSTHVEWLYTKNGQASFVLKSPLIDRYGGGDPYLEFPKGLEINSFEITGQKDASLSADYAIQNLNTSIIEARGMVDLENAEGEKLETEYLIWDEKEEQIHTKENVKITKSNQVIMGEGFISYIDYHIKQHKKQFFSFQPPQESQS